jgi:hypothetical protein
MKLSAGEEILKNSRYGRTIIMIVRFINRLVKGML